MSEPIWSPSKERIENANISAFIRQLQAVVEPGIVDYPTLYQFSIDHPETFWRALWDYAGIIGDPGQRVLIDAGKMPGARFFPDARLNFAENLLRYDDDQPAIRFRSETGVERRLNYRELRCKVAGLAAFLRDRGVVEGDRVAAYMPNLPETVIAMLAATSIGAIWSSCSPDFGVHAVVDRFGQIEPRVMICASAYSYNGKTFDCLEKAGRVLDEVDSILQLIVVPYVDETPDLSDLKNAILLDDAIDPGSTELQFNRLPFDHPLYVLYSSGTTGVPKCITHGAGGVLLQHCKELLLHTDVKRDDKVFFFTTCGWMMWNWLVSTLATGATVVLYDGSPFYPNPASMFDLMDDFGITHFGTGAKAIAAWEKAGIKARQTHKLGKLKTILSTGSPLAPESFDYIYRDIKADICVSSISGGTDLVSCFALGCPVLPVYRGEIQCLGLAMKVEIRNDAGAVLEHETGELTCSAPFPPMPVYFWGDEDGSKYRAAYFERFPGIWAHGDYARITEHGGMIIYGRSDAILNPGGVRIGTSEIYRQVEKLDEVLDSVCVGQDWGDDVRVVLFVKLRDGLVLDEDLNKRICSTIRAGTSPRHVPAKILQVSDVPRTLSGKVVELAVRNVIHGRQVRNLDALANPESLAQFEDLPELES